MHVRFIPRRDFPRLRSFEIVHLSPPPSGTVVAKAQTPAAREPAAELALAMIPPGSPNPLLMSPMVFRICRRSSTVWLNDGRATTLSALWCAAVRGVSSGGACDGHVQEVRLQDGGLLRYCGKACQKKDWKAHKKVCNKK